MAHVKIKLLDPAGNVMYPLLYYGDHGENPAHRSRLEVRMITPEGVTTYRAQESGYAFETSIAYLDPPVLAGDPPLRPNIHSPQALQEWAMTRGAASAMLVPSARYPLEPQRAALARARELGWPADPDAEPETDPPQLYSAAMVHYSRSAYSRAADYIRRVTRRASEVRSS